jgi:hypothetical protein
MLRNFLIFVFLMPFLLGCGTLGTNIYDGEERFVESQGGFSIIPPARWVARNVGGLTFRTLNAPESTGDNPVRMVFSISNMNTQIGPFADNSLRYWGDNDHTFRVISRSEFVTADNVVGIRVHASMIFHRMPIFCYFYFIPGQGKAMIIESQVYSSQRVASRFEPVFDSAVRTFRWF